MNLTQLTGLLAFARAATVGSYTAAARLLGVSPSAVSKSVSRLEDRLGVTLFVRTTRSLTLSPEGRDLHERALRLLQEAEAIEQAALSARSAPSGVLRVTAALPIGTHVLGPALPRFHERHPEVRVDLRLTDQLLDLVNERIDVAIRVGQLNDSQLGSRRFGPHRVGAFASPAYLAEHGKPKTPQDLVRHQCVAVRFQSTGQTLRWPFQVGGRVVELVPDAWLTVDSTEANVAVLSAGGGISIIPHYVAAPYVAAGKLVPVLAAHSVERFAFTALWPASRRSNPNVRAFLAFLDEVFTVPAPWEGLTRGRRTRSTSSLRLE